MLFPTMVAILDKCCPGAGFGPEMPDKYMTESFLFIHFHAKSSLAGQQQPAQHQPLTNKTERRGFILHEAGEFHVERRIAFPDRFDDALQIVLVQFRQFQEAIVGQQIGQFLSLAFVILVIDRHHFGAHEQGRLEPTMTAHDQAAAVADGNGSPPALFLDDGREELNLMGAMLVRVDRVGRQFGRINQGIMGAVDFEAHACLPRVNLDRRRGDMRRLRTQRPSGQQETAA